MKQPMILVTAGYQIAKNGTRQRYLYQNYADGIPRGGRLSAAAARRRSLCR